MLACVLLALFLPTQAGPLSCPGFHVAQGTVGVALDPFDNRTGSTAADCCDLCTSHGIQCGAWTLHTGTDMCYVSTTASPHQSDSVISGTRVTPPTPPPPSPPPTKPPLDYQPNIIFILTDDQDTRLGAHDYTELGSLQAMPQTRRLLMEQGTRFSNFFVNTPICCPSRTESFSGRYYHNLVVQSGGCMHVAAKENVFAANTSVFSLLEQAGYSTGVFGKVTNDQGGDYWLPSDESTWLTQGMGHISSPINYNSYTSPQYFRKDANGTTWIETLDKQSPVYGTDYQTAQIGNRTLAWLDMLQATKSEKPFFAYVGPHAPHFPAMPAPWHAHAFDKTLNAPRTVNFNVSSPGKATHIQQNPALDDNAACWLDQHMRDRWASLLSVDDLVGALVSKLDQMGVLDKTFIFYTSDHGYKLGQWRVGTSKQHPYDVDIRVPLLVRGPGVRGGEFGVSAVASNVDLAPTFLDLAGVGSPSFMDGKSLVPFLQTPEAQAEAESTWRDRMIHEYWSVGTYYNDHASIWHDETSGPTGVWTCQGQTAPKSPSNETGACVESSGVGDGNCWMLDSKASNSWRAVRIINEQENVVYVEYDHTWTWDSELCDHYEVYDLNQDPYQLNNIYQDMSPSQLASYHDSLEMLYRCSGLSCP